jgi:hypothetical protein
MRISCSLTLQSTFLASLHFAAARVPLLGSFFSSEAFASHTTPLAPRCSYESDSCHSLPLDLWFSQTPSSSSLHLLDLVDPFSNLSLIFLKRPLEWVEQDVPESLT